MTHVSAGMCGVQCMISMDVSLQSSYFKEQLLSIVGIRFRKSKALPNMEPEFHFAYEDWAPPQMHHG
jgi:hypothetical protein